MRLKTLFLASFLTFSLLTAGCADSEPANNQNANTPNINTNAKTDSQNPLETTKTPEAATTNNAPTLTPVVKAYCEAIIKKDEATLRRIHSQERLKAYGADMKSENEMSLAEFLSGLDPITDAGQCTARNEKIEGDKAVAEIRNENAPNGAKLQFLRENGEWKIDKPVFENVQQPAANPVK